MATEEGYEETQVSERGMVTIPADIRWTADEDGTLSVEVVKQRYGACDDDDLQAPMGGDGLETHDLAGYEQDPAFSEDS